MTLLGVADLCKSYGALAVTRNVTLDVRPGELHAIIGPNGAGKTTLIGQLSGQIQPDSGKITLEGRDITRLSMSDRVHLGLARSFQITSILPRFTVLENVALAIQARSGSSFRFFGRVSRETRINDTAMRFLADAGLDARAHIRAEALSHGEHRHLELAIALATEPRLLLLDEPLAGIGGAEAETFIQRLSALKGRYGTVLIEHDMDAVFALADRISVLVYGEIIASGPPDLIRDDPLVRAAYLGEEEAA